VSHPQEVHQDAMPLNLLLLIFSDTFATPLDSRTAERYLCGGVNASQQGKEKVCKIFSSCMFDDYFHGIAWP
jgi:hypothetical protein